MCNIIFILLVDDSHDYFNHNLGVPPHMQGKGNQYTCRVSQSVSQVSYLLCNQDYQKYAMICNKTNVLFLVIHDAHHLFLDLSQLVP